METTKVLYNGEEIIITVSVDKDEIEAEIENDKLEETLDLTNDLKDLETTKEFKKEDFNGR